MVKKKLRKEYKNGKIRYIYTEKDIRAQGKGDGERLGAKQTGSKRAGEKYEKATEFFVRRRSSQTSNSTSREDQEIESRKNIERDFIKYCKQKKLWIEYLSFRWE
ncbi:hypothetical protein PG637_02630 [Riemerella anatipestifer]|nr:hypothetical protein [Riemerella anatipestifer]MDY3353377.1 hypothetical protein [Riemerella anatipestifer]